MYFSSECIDLSRPKPDCLKPPNGALMSPASNVFTQTTPARSGPRSRMRGAHVVGPDRRSQAVDRVVRDRDRVLELVELIVESTGPKISSCAIRMRVRDRVEDRWLDVIPARVLPRTRAAEAQLGAFVLARLDVTQHAVELGRIDDRAHARLRIEGIARLDLRRDRDDPLQELVLTERCTSSREPRCTPLPGCRNAPGNRLGSRIEIAALGHDDVRRLPAALERDALHVRLAGITQEDLPTSVEPVKVIMSTSV